jgi:hypothetical protein
MPRAAFSSPALARVRCRSMACSRFGPNTTRMCARPGKELESRAVEFVTDVDGNESEAWGLFSRPDGYLYAVADGTPLESAPAHRAVNQPVRRGKTSVRG